VSTFLIAAIGFIALIALVRTVLWFVRAVLCVALLAVVIVFLSQHTTLLPSSQWLHQTSRHLSLPSR